MAAPFAQMEIYRLDLLCIIYTHFTKIQPDIFWYFFETLGFPLEEKIKLCGFKQSSAAQWVFFTGLSNIKLVGRSAVLVRIEI